MLELDDPVGEIAGVGPQRVAELRQAGILTVGDLLMVLPLRYEDRRERATVADLEPGRRQGVEAEVLRVRRKGPPGRRQAVEAVLADDTGEMRAVWFNQPYMSRRLEPGWRGIFFGRVDEYQDDLQLVNPVVADPDGTAPSLHVDRPVPVYRRIGSLGPGLLRRLVASALADLNERSGRLPDAVRQELDLLSTRDALAALHYPPQDAELDRWNEQLSPAHRALAVAEFVDFQVVLALQRRRARDEPGVARDLPTSLIDRIAAALPFELTAAQHRVAGEILSDLRQERPMHRLVQGDVGSGKTAVLGLPALAVAAVGEQAAVLAPTEILARQHEATLGAWGARVGVEVLGLTGSSTAAERRELLARLAAGEPAVVVGTHALLEPDVEMSGLGLVIVDEQHRFGVGQRAALRAKGKRRGVQPDLLVTTATPIPRSLALTLYGDLEVSRIDELPPGRRPVRTETGSLEDLENLARRLGEVVAAGGRAYVVAPAIDPGEDEDAPVSVITLQDALAARLPGAGMGILHGRLDAASKAAALDAFSAGTTPILVATTVVEVGVDVPSATFIAVAAADRFGLAQLHQLRGRVGRSDAGGECWLLTSDSVSADAAVRLATLCATHDGFVVAEEDLRLRGAGELLGYRQTGPFGFRIANPRRHHEWLLAARDVARDLTDSASGEARRYRQALRQSWAARMRLVRAG